VEIQRESVAVFRGASQAQVPGGMVDMSKVFAGG
jgi:hypothetical protein